MALTDRERVVLFRMIKEGALTEAVNDEIRGDDVKARETIAEFKVNRLDAIAMILPKLIASADVSQRAVQEILDLKELLENV